MPTPPNDHPPRPTKPARRGFGGAVMRIYGAVDQRIEVVASSRPSAIYRRLTFHAPGLFQDGVSYDPGAWLRMWLPDVEGKGREFQRGYTMVEVEPARQRFAIDFLLHATDGPGSAWARQAEVGDTLEVQYFGGAGFQPPELEPAGYLLVADEASLPAANEILLTLPPHLPVELLLECSEHSREHLPVAHHPGLRIRHVLRQAEPQALADRLEDRDWTDWYAWVAVEVSATKAVRQRLQAMGFPREFLKAQGYWVKGKEMGQTRQQGAAGASATTEDFQGPVLVDTPGQGSSAAPAAGRGAKGARRQAGKPAATTGGWRVAAGRRLLAPLRPQFITAGVLQAIATLLQLAPFLLVTQLASQLLAGAEAEVLRRTLLLAGLLFAAGATIGVALLFAMHLLDARFGFELRQTLLRKLSRLPLGWFGQQSSGRIQQVVEADSAALHYLVTHAVLDFVAAAVGPLAVLVYLLAVDARLALFLLLPLLGTLLLNARMMYKAAPALPQALRWAAQVRTQAVAWTDGLAVARVFRGGIADRFAQTLREKVSFFERWQLPLLGERVRADLTARPLTVLLLLLAVGSLFVALGWMPPARLLPFLVLGPTLSSQLLALAYGAAALREGQEAARRIGLLLEERELEATAPSEPIADPEPAAAAGRRGAEVEFREVSFGYHRHRPVVRELSFRLPAGSISALVGPSGAGKSTVAALLARFHDPDAGHVLLDGQALSAIPMEQLYRRVGFVFQKTHVLHASFRDNLTLAKPEAGEEEVARAVQEAQLAEVLARLPRGLDTLLGSEARLSGGEAQQLAVARLLLTDPDLVVLDEATAYADPESEAAVQRAISGLTAGRTVLVVAHRLRTIADVDRILVMQDGRLVQQGRHEALLAEPGLYAQLWAEATMERAA